MNDIPKDLVVLQLTQRALGVESELGAVFLVKGYRAGLSPSDLASFLVPLSVLEKWCNGGKPQSRCLFEFKYTLIFLLLPFIIIILIFLVIVVVIFIVSGIFFFGFEMLLKNLMNVEGRTE